MGIGYDSSLWTLAQVPALSTLFQVVIVDNRDAGAAQRPAARTALQNMADDLAGLLDALGIQRTHLLGLLHGRDDCPEVALRHAARLDRLVLAGTGAAPARSAVDPIQIWSWVKANDTTGKVFGGQQFVSLFSTAFLRNHEAVAGHLRAAGKQSIPMSPEAYDRQADAYLQFDALGRLTRNHRPDPRRRGGTRPGDDHPGSRTRYADAIPVRGSRSSRDGSSHVVPIERPDDFNRLVFGLPCRVTGMKRAPMRSRVSLTSRSPRLHAQAVEKVIRVRSDPENGRIETADGSQRRSRRTRIWDRPDPDQMRQDLAHRSAKIR